MRPQAPNPRPSPPAARKQRDIPGWIQVGLAILAFFGLTGTALLNWFGLHPPVPVPTATAIAVPTGTAWLPSTPTGTTERPAPTGTTRRPAPTVTTKRPGPVRTTGRPDPPPIPSPPDVGPGPQLVGTWAGTSQLSAHESTSLRMTLSLAADGRYGWTRDVIRDSGYWEVNGEMITFDQDSGGRYEWPFQLSGSGSRRVLILITTQGGTTRLRRTG